MVEPAASSCAGLGASCITLAGSILGVQYDALTIGLAGGAAALMHLPSASGPIQKFGSVATSALVGGVLSPLGAAGAVKAAPWVSSIGDTPLRLSCAFILGLVAQVAIPLLFARMKKEGDQA